MSRLSPRNEIEYEPLGKKILFWRRIHPIWQVLLYCFLTGIFVHVLDQRTPRPVSPSPPESPRVPMQNGKDEKDSWPKVAWLMSFPNSGTTYTTEVVVTMTNTTTGTNYGLECPNDESVPILKDLTGGPFWKDPAMDRPARFVLTKTHCGGRCTECGPEKYVETMRSFEVACRSGNINGNRDGPGRKMEMVQYNATRARVTKAVHLVRNPLDNLVSRLHMERKRWEMKGDREGRLRKFPSSKDGLQAWCRFLDSHRYKEELASRWMDKDLMSLERRVPCHAEFYRYIQWHNLALEVTKRMKLETMVLYYEDYTDHFEETVHSLLDFLELEPVAKPRLFVTGKHYDQYFDAEEVATVLGLVRELASSDTLALLERYFTPWL
eukprot:CAMPEP_0116836370 /NCGR_PEP_ID=MMETSP0418-20121206/8061_1 /TAXON_ID=1158023 /ORGANISM="Astrosyne radiata, Strain 13vi08-1A" /LENGTH=379 /DNA_ID=CAMNT_0004466137 /DNA_START=1500 /DNA_END=2639 /DNA_ORIENTATION=-